MRPVLHVETRLLLQLLMQLNLGRGTLPGLRGESDEESLVPFPLGSMRRG